MYQPYPCICFFLFSSDLNLKRGQKGFQIFHSKISKFDILKKPMNKLQSSHSKYKGKIDPSRSKSAPSILKSSYIKPSNSKILTRKPCFEIEEPCQFYLTEIPKRRFISANIRNSLIDQIKLIKNIGSKIVQTKTKNESISKQFWKIWNGFQNTLVQEFNHQIYSTKSSIKKSLASLKDYIKFIGNEDKQDEVSQLVNHTIEELNQDSNENFSYILSEFKDLQAYISSGDVNSKQRNVNFQLTPVLSPILTQLQNLKDIKATSDRFFTHIDEDTQTFQSLIHDEYASSPSSKVSPKKALTAKKSQPAFHMANDKNNDNSSNTYTDSEDQLSINISNAKEENAKLKKQIEEMQKKKSDKRIELEDKRKEELNEIKNLKSTISQLKQKSKQLSAQNTSRSTKSSSMYVPLNPLRTEIRELELEQVRLDAANSFLLDQIDANSNPKQSNTLSGYQKNSELANKRSELNKELFQLRVKCIQINKVIQKATAKTYETNGNDQQIRKDFKKAQQVNDEMRSKLDKIISDFNDQKTQHEEELANKIKLELQREEKSQNPNNDEENDSNSFDDGDNEKVTDKSANLQQQLNNVKQLYRNRKQNLIEEEQRKQIKSARRLRKKTENELTLLRCNSKSDYDDMMAQAQEVNKQYVEITNQYNEAQKSNKDKVSCNGQNLSKEEAEKEIEKLITKFTNLNIRINKSNAEEANKENLIMKNEIAEIENGNTKLIDSISDVKKKSVKMHSKIQSLHLQHQIFEMKNQDLQYDVNQAFEEAINDTNQQNLVLQDMLDNSIADLKKLNIEVPF